MNKEEIKIIALGDIFRNLETEEQAFEFLKYIKNLQQENKELKKQLENYKKLGFKHLQDKNNNLETQQKEFIKYLELEKDRLARECSNVYEDGLGRTRLVNEDIFNEIDNILQKYREIIGK